MVKLSIVFALLLGVVFAQMVPAFSSKSGKETEGSNKEANDVEEAEEGSVDESVALTETPKKEETSETPKKEETSETPKKEENTETPKKSSNTNEKTKNDSEASSPGRRFELPDFDKDFLKNYAGRSVSETFLNEDYELKYSKSTGGNIDFTWKKWFDEVRMSISSGGSISQTWLLDDVSFFLERSSGGSISQFWDFGNTSYTYTKSSGGMVTENWAEGVIDQDSLKEGKRLIDEWCRENDFLLNDKKQCIIY